jgi:hypothetical protein
MIARGTSGRMSMQPANCTMRASLGNELANFKSIIRHIIATNADPTHQCMFTLDKRSHIRRLSPFAIIGHQPGINATRITTEGERRKIESAILRQRMGTTSKQAIAMMRSVHARRDEGNICLVKLKRAKLDTKSVPLWVRSYRSNPITMVKDSMPYTSRMLKCTTCGHRKETAHMQLRMPTGFRGIVCTKCHRQSRAIKNLCQCEVIWHKCPLHQCDPAVHRSEKPATDSNSGKPKKVKALLSLHRTAPEALASKPAKRRRIEAHSGGRQLHSHGTGCEELVAPRLSLDKQPRLAARFPHLASRG